MTGDPTAVGPGRDSVLSPQSSVPPRPDDVAALTRWLEAQPDAEALHPVTMRHVSVASNALLRLPDLLVDLDAPRRVLLVMDSTPMDRVGDDLKPLVHEAVSGQGRRVTPFVFTPGADGLVHADLEGVARLRAAIGTEPTAVVALGSGSVVDMAKRATHLAECEDGARVTLAIVPTAPSVTAFTSSLAVLLKDGVKRSFPARFPDAVVCDLETLRSAPLEMRLAGLGDCVARFVSYADWYFSDQLGLVELYSETPLALMGADLDQEYLRHAEAVGQGTDEGMTFLMWQVLLAGLAQSIVQLSAPLSGTEHVVSHVLDMGAGAWRRPTGLHGAQVGVATPLAARAYELLFERFDATRPRPTPPDPDAAERAIGAGFGRLDPSGRMAAEVWSEYRQKLAAWAANEARFDDVRERWTSEVMPRLRQLARPSATIRQILLLAGHPLRFENLSPRIPSEQARFALAHAHFMRKRFAIADLFVFLGHDPAALADELLEPSAPARTR